MTSSSMVWERVRAFPPVSTRRSTSSSTSGGGISTSSETV